MTTHILRHPLRRITEVPCKCPACGWEGLTGHTEADVDGDGSLGCPRCHTIVVIERNEHEMDPENCPQCLAPSGEGVNG